MKKGSFMKIKLPKILTIFLILFFIGTSTVLAQDIENEQKIVVSGVADETGNLSINLQGNPGDILSSETTVTNLSADQLKIETTLQDFIIDNENGVPTMVEAGSTIWSMSKWIRVPEDFQEFIIEPNETIDVPFTIEIPEDATPGGHYTMILMSPVIVEEEVVGPLVENKVGNLVKLEVSGDVQESAEIIQFDAPYFSEYGPIPLTLKILNDGNTHLSVSGTVEIQNTLGSKVAEWSIKPANVFPTAVRLWETKWAGKWRFGIYRAKVDLQYGTEDLPLSSEVYFWVIPWKIVIGILIVVILLIIWGYNKNKKTNKMKVSPGTKEPVKKKSKLPSLDKLKNEDNAEKV